MNQLRCIMVCTEISEMCNLAEMIDRLLNTFWNKAPCDLLLSAFWSSQERFLLHCYNAYIIQTVNVQRISVFVQTFYIKHECALFILGMNCLNTDVMFRIRPSADSLKFVEDQLDIGLVLFQDASLHKW